MMIMKKLSASELERRVRAAGVEAIRQYNVELERILVEEPTIARDDARRRAGLLVLGLTDDGGGGGGVDGRLDDSVAAAAGWEDQFSPGNMERNVSWVAATLGGLVAPAPSYHALALLAFVRRGAFAESAFWSNHYAKFMPSRREVERRARQSDDGRSLADLCDTLARYAEGSDGSAGESGVSEEGGSEGGD